MCCNCGPVSLDLVFSKILILFAGLHSFEELLGSFHALFNLHRSPWRRELQHHQLCASCCEGKMLAVVFARVVVLRTVLWSEISVSDPGFGAFLNPASGSPFPGSQTQIFSTLFCCGHSNSFCIIKYYQIVKELLFKISDPEWLFPDLDPALKFQIQPDLVPQHCLRFIVGLYHYPHSKVVGSWTCIRNEDFLYTFTSKF